ncbi:hypothetical protein NC651_031929 [Populus alba x Populus x berolinensis]|nr:hypothetical protein NC651_031929 [Populus alba x Populus x berolinensis]
MLLLISQSYSMHLCLSPTLSSQYKGPVFNLSPPNSSFYLQLTIRHALSLFAIGVHFFFFFSYLEAIACKFGSFLWFKMRKERGYTSLLVHGYL